MPLRLLIREEPEALGDGPRQEVRPLLHLLAGERLAGDPAGVGVAGPAERMAAVPLIVDKLLQGDGVGDIWPRY